MSNLQSLCSSIGRPRILVLGDLMLDRYTWGEAERISPEAPVIVLRADDEEVRPGGAASVAYLLRHLDAEVALAGIVGDDSNGRTLRALLHDEGIDDQLVLSDPSRSTTCKHRYVGRASNRHPHQIVRVDHESRTPMAESLVTDLWNRLEHRLTEFQAILISDYLKGVCTEPLLQQVISAARAVGIPVLIDPGRTPNYFRYRGATLIKPNRVEAALAGKSSFATGVEALATARSLRVSLDLDAVIITLDRDGSIVATADEELAIASSPRAVYDITGAGDMVLATLGLCVAGGLSIPDAARIANVAAGLEVERFGVAPVDRTEVLAKLSTDQKANRAKQVTADGMVDLADRYRREGKKIVFTNGCFDLLHIGHVSYLQEAAALGDVLVVAVNSDGSVKRLKGSTRPVIRDEDRSALLAALSCVTHVLIFEEDTPESLLRRIRPDVLVKGGTTTDIVGREIVEAYGGRVCLAGQVPGVSTTQLIHAATGCA